MTKKELRRMSRLELLELLLDIDRENERLREEVTQLKMQLQSRQLKLEKAGSIAEAALALTRVFESAQAAADLYLENIRTLGDGGCTDGT